MTASVTASPANRTRARAVITDHPWPDVRIEQSILEGAGIDLFAGPAATGTAADVEAMVAQHDPHAILTCWAQVSEAAIGLPTELRIVARMGVGLDNIAVAAATRRGAWVTNVPDYCVEEVSDHAIALLLNAWRGIASFDREVKAGRWNPESAKLRRLAGSTIGIVGYGRIGSTTARKLASGFRCRVLVTSPTLVDAGGAGPDPGAGIRAVDLETIQREADAIILHAPSVAATRHLVNDDFLRRCARRPLLINVSRGALVDNDALLRALAADRISGAALDVIEGEPSPPLELMRHPAVTVTPHVAFSSDASLAELRRRVAEEVVRVVRGQPPLHPCNAPVLP